MVQPKTLIVLVGLPRSGKTTWALNASVRHQAPIVCPDAIRYALHGQRYVTEAENFVWAIAHTMVAALFLAGHATVIVDATNGTRKRREQWRSTRWATRYQCMEADKAVCLARAVELGDDEIVPVIERMAAELEPLAADEPLLADFPIR